MSITVADLLKLPSLRESRVAAGEGGLSRIVSSISVLEYADPGSFQEEMFHNNEFYGSEIVISGLAGARSVARPDYFGTANAIGSAISKVSGTYEQLVNYDEIPRDEALAKAKAKAEAFAMAVAAGAVPGTVEIIDVEDVPLAYYPGNTNRVKIKAAGDLV